MFQPWTDLPIETTVDEVVGRSFAVFGERNSMVATVPAFVGTPPAGTRLVEAWVRRGWTSRVVREHLPRFESVGGFAMRQGVLPQRVQILPPLQWPVTGAPHLLIDGRAVGIDEIRDRVFGPSAQRVAAVARAADVRETYGRLLGDVAYRIENSALFDTSVPLTRSFATALALWQDVTDETEDAEVVRRSGVLVLSFDTARAHAETVGFGHLPVQARADADRAAKAAKLAAGTPSDAERELALSQVKRLLSSLALYYLPDPDAVDRALTTGT